MAELAIMAARLTLVGNAERAAGLEIGERRRLALRAVQDRDLEGLWALVAAHLVLHGRRGSRVSGGTLRKYRSAIAAYWAWADASGVNLARPGPDTGRAFLRHLEGRGLVRSSVGLHLAACRGLYEALRWCGVRPEDPFRDARPVPDPRAKHQLGKPYSLAEIDRLLAVADEEGQVVVTLGADCGLRAGEIAGLTRANVHLHRDPPTLLVLGKGAKTREVVLSRRAEAALRRWLEMTAHTGQPRVLMTGSTDKLEDLLRRLCAHAGVPYAGRTVHGLRRTAGTRAYTQTRDLLDTRDFLGHAQASTTEVYIHYARALEKAVNRDW